MLKKILIVIALVIAVFLIFAAIRPSEYHFQKQLAIKASPEAIFPYVNNTRKMNSWNPYVKMDPQIKLSYEGPEEGRGAISTWESEKVGVGRSTITESIPGTLVRANLEFKKPFEGTQKVEFSLLPQGDQTMVTWAVSGHNNFMARIFCMFMSMEKMMGETFSKGLSDLKQMVEQQK